MQDPRLDRAITDHIPLADSLAWAFITRLACRVDGDEARAVALEALVRAGSRWVDPYRSDRGFDPWDQDDPSKPEAHFTGHVVKVVRGAIMDWARREDHVTRSIRNKLKQIYAAQADGQHRTSEELAEQTGLTLEQVRAALVAEAMKPNSLDSHMESGTEYAGAVLADPGADVEEKAVGSSIMAGFPAAYGALDAETMVVLALRYASEFDWPVIAKALFTTEDRVRKLHDAGVLEVYIALLLAAAG